MAGPPGSPSKRPRIFDGDQEEEQSRIQQLEAQLQKCQREVASLRKELQSVKNDNRAYSLSEERLAERYGDLRDEANLRKVRDSKVISELNATIARLQKTSFNNAETQAIGLEASRLLNQFADTVEKTVTDVAEAEDGAEGHDCAVCYDTLKMADCSLLLCGHYYHSARVAAIPATLTEEEDDDGEQMSQIECPECRKPCLLDHVVQGLKNFDQGWEILIRLATKWKELSINDESGDICSDDQSESSNLSNPEGPRASIKPSRRNSDDYESTDHEEFEDPEQTPPGSPKADDDTFRTPSRALGAQMDGLLMSSANRRRNLESLAAKRAAKARR